MMRCMETAYRGKEMKFRRKTKGLLYWGVTVLLMILIFFFSAKTGTQSAGMSIGYARELAKFLGWVGIFSMESGSSLVMYAESVHTLVRKAAHFTEYAILGFFTYKAVSCDVTNRKKAMIISQMICSGYAITDEIHQTFVPGREGRVFDVVIDSFGSMTGILIAAFISVSIHK